MPAELKLAPFRGAFAVRSRHDVACSSREVITKDLPLAVLLALLLLLTGAGFVAGDPGAQAMEAMEEARPALDYVRDAHLRYYEEHLARMVAESSSCR